MLGEERHDRREHAHELHERGPQGAERRLVRRVEAPARAADVPVGEVFHERLDGTHDVDGEVRVVGRLGIGDELLHACQQPPVQRAQFDAGGVALEVLVDRLETLDGGVVGEEANRVPQREQPALDLVGRPEAETDVLGWRLARVHPAHDVGAHALERVVGGNQIAPGSVHLAPVGVEQLLEGQHAPEWHAAGEHDRHEEDRVEPEPDLLAHLRHPGRGEPLLPIGVIGQVGGRDTMRGAGGIAPFAPSVVVPAERRERDDARVQPHIAHLGDALHRAVALRAADLHAVDPRAVQFGQVGDLADRAVLELLPRADHVQMAANARVEGQRQPVEATARDVPVPHVAQPVVHALAVLRRRPLDGLVLVEHRLAHALHRDEPVVGDAEDQRCIAAPAVRVGVPDRLGPREPSRRSQVLDDGLGRLVRGETAEPPVARIEAARLVDGREHGEVVRARQLEVIASTPGRDVDDPGALGELDALPRDHPVIGVLGRRQVVERADGSASRRGRCRA